MGNLTGYNAEDYNPNTGTFDPVPGGEYLCQMVNSEFKETKNGDGEYLQCDWQVLDGEHKGRIIFDRLNLKNSNDTAVKIANNTLSAICHAVGVLRPDDSAELHGKPVVVVVEVEERNDKPGSFSNRVKGYRAPGDALAKNTATKSTAKTGDGKVPPWKRK